MWSVCNKLNLWHTTLNYVVLDHRKLIAPNDLKRTNDNIDLFGFLLACQPDVPLRVVRGFFTLLRMLWHQQAKRVLALVIVLRHADKSTILFQNPEIDRAAEVNPKPLHFKNQKGIIQSNSFQPYRQLIGWIVIVYGLLIRLIVKWYKTDCNSISLQVTVNKINLCVCKNDTLSNAFLNLTYKRGNCYQITYKELFNPNIRKIFA